MKRVHFEVKRSKIKVTAKFPDEGIPIDCSPSTTNYSFSVTLDRTEKILYNVEDLRPIYTERDRRRRAWCKWAFMP